MSKAQKKLPARAMPRDLALLHGPTEDGRGARLLRFREGTVTAGEIRPAREGQPVGSGELVRLRPLHPEVPVCEVEVVHAPQAPAEDVTRTAGPARVSTQRYRRNWGVVFGRKHDRRDHDWSIN